MVRAMLIKRSQEHPVKMPAAAGGNKIATRINKTGRGEQGRSGLAPTSLEREESSRGCDVKSTNDDPTCARVCGKPPTRVEAIRGLTV